MSVVRTRVLTRAVVIAVSSMLALPAAAVELEENEQGAVIRTTAYAAAISTAGA